MNQSRESGSDPNIKFWVFFVSFQIHMICITNYLIISIQCTIKKKLACFLKTKEMLAGPDPASGTLRTAALEIL